MSTQSPEHRTNSTNVSPADLPRHIERVDEAFDNTSLPQAHEEGIVSDHVPPHYEDLEQHVDPDQANFLENPQPKREIRWGRRGLVIGGAAAALAGALFVGSKLASPDAAPAPNTPPNPDKTASAPALPGATVSAGEHAPGTPSPEDGYPVPTAEQIKIPATLSPEEVGRAIEDRFTAWGMAGATTENRKTWLHTSDDNALLADIASKNAKVFADNLFVDGWDSNERLSASVASARQINLEKVRAWFKTAQHARGAKEAYHEWIETEAVKVISSSPNGGVIDISAIGRDNVAMNHVDNVEIGIEDHINVPFTAHVTYVKEGDSFKIVSFGG